MSIAGSSEQGFTLIELIVVMALISLTVSFAVPQIRSSLYTNELNSAVRRFVGVVAEIGQEARLKRAAVVLRYDRQQRLFTTAKGDGEKNQGVRLPDSVQVTGIDAAHRSESTELSIAFDQRGYTDRMAVYFRHDNGDEQTVLLSPFLGSVRIVDGHVSLDDTRLTLTR